MSLLVSNWSRLVRALSACSLLALSASACGGGSIGGSPAHGRESPDGGALQDAAAYVGHAPDDGGANGCKTQCDPDDCGEFVVDGCGGHLVCPLQCPEGQGCGLQRPDKCDAPTASCAALSEAEACAGKCGIVSDGCSAVFACTAENGGVSCGAGQTCDEHETSATHNGCIAAQILCTPLSCADQGLACGPAGDGCGGVLDCTAESGGCTGGKTCGVGADSGKCVAPPTCTRKTAAAACAGTCGAVSDGCGGTIDCAASPTTACPAGTTCGGGGTRGVCGSGGAACVPVSQTTACAGKCGWVADGCGGPGYQCTSANGGLSCDPNAGQTCVNAACVAPMCTPKTTNQACPGDGAGHKSCGLTANGCNGTIDCGGCAVDETCGRAGPSLCGPNPSCQPTPIGTACSGKCGTVANGCGGTYTCDGTNGGVSCSGSEYCGAVQANKCGTPPITCTPKTCSQLGHSCGLASDGCGKVINCWSGCSSSDPSCTGTCGASAACEAAPSSGAQSCVAGTAACSGTLCSMLPTGCASVSPTRLTGTVRTPGRQVNGSWINQLPVPNAIVYIPADPGTALPAVLEGIDPNNPLSCGRCADEKLVADGQSVLAAAVSDYRGQFTLEGRIPVNTAFKLVIKVGKWRRVVQVPSGVAKACTSQPLALDVTRLAANSTDGLSGTHLPKVAISTGKVDEMECVFRNVGLDEAEFTVPSGAGRLHMYRANGARMGVSTQTCTGQYKDSNNNKVNCANNSNFGCVNNKSGCSWQTNTTDVSVADSALFGNLTTLEKYDLVVWDCEGSENFEAAPAPSHIESYVDAGGRMFASHFSYVWIENNGTLDASADWGMSGTASSDTGYISLPAGPTARKGANAIKSPLLRDWLDWQGALTGTTANVLDSPTTPQFTISDPRDRAGANVGASTDEWVYRNARFCSNKASVLCSADADCMVCSNDAGRSCRQNGDCQNGGTCGAKVCSNDGSKLCSQNSNCSNGGTCGAPTCKAALNPRVQQLSFNTPYGVAEDQICGRVAYSGFHVANANDNSGSYFPAICGDTELTAQEKVLAFMLFDLTTCVSAGDPPAPPACTPKTAAQVCPNVNDACGYLSDGCGGVIDCAGCAAGFYCDGSACKLQACPPAPCSSLGFNCGQHADGCGGIARNSFGVESCGTCSGGQVCGLGGPGLCGTASCTKIALSTACPANSCGLVSDGCGGTYNCGSCTSGNVCGGGGANLCGAGSCNSISKATACMNKNCGFVSDGCGGTYDCGVCTAPASCGGSGKANVCGTPSCTPYTKVEACTGLECGWVSDGCGGAIQCGTCANGGVCGGAGPNLCGGSCSPTTCNAQGAQCGAIADACGGILQCGSCPSGQTCGAAGANKCGTAACTPLTCVAAGAQCGLIGDGCGGVLDCGLCTAANETCGGAGVPNHCGAGTGGCNRLSCADQSVQCGAASDGCGGVLDCGGCQSGEICERSACVPAVLLF